MHLEYHSLVENPAYSKSVNFVSKYVSILHDRQAEKIISISQSPKFTTYRSGALPITIQSKFQNEMTRRIAKLKFCKAGVKRTRMSLKGAGFGCCMSQQQHQLAD
jgi:hypothetical protein